MDSISVAVLPPGHESAEVDKNFHDEPSVRRMIARSDHPGRLRVCYEAGPTGYELARLHRAGELIAIRVPNQCPTPTSSTWLSRCGRI